jgi:choline kinase
VINAAGIGSRLDYGLPKCLVPVLGRPLIDWQLDLLEDAEVVVVAGFRAHDISTHLRSVRPDVPIVLNHDFHNTGTAASLRRGARLAGEHVLSLDGDLLVEPTYLDAWLTGSATSIGVSPRTTREAVGLEIDDAGLVRAMGFEIDSPLEWNGLLRMPRDVVLQLGDGHVFESLVEHLPISVLPGDTVEIDHPHDLERAAEWLTKRVDGTMSRWTR